MKKSLVAEFSDGLSHRYRVAAVDEVVDQERLWQSHVVTATAGSRRDADFTAASGTVTLTPMLDVERFRVQLVGRHRRGADRSATAITELH